jgi:DNA-binding NtrC family response regulator
MEEKIKILLVDDEENVRNALKRVLKREGYEVYSAGGGAEALSHLQQICPDVIISDFLMPDMNGIEFLKKTREVLPEIIRIILTAHADLQIALQAINDAGVYRLLTKPWDDAELKIMLNQINAHIALLKENSRLKAIIKTQEETLKRLENEYPGITMIKKTRDGAIIIE